MLKSITLHRPAVDNVDGFHDAGADLIVGDEAKAGVIAEDRAKEIVSTHGAVGHHETAKEKPANKRTAGKRKPGAKQPAPVEPTKAAEPVEPAATKADLEPTVAD